MSSGITPPMAGSPDRYSPSHPVKFGFGRVISWLRLVCSGNYERMDSRNAAARLLAEILAAGVTVDGFIRCLRVDPQAVTTVLPPQTSPWRIPPPGHSY